MLLQFKLSSTIHCGSTPADFPWLSNDYSFVVVVKEGFDGVGIVSTFGCTFKIDG